MTDQPTQVAPENMFHYKQWPESKFKSGLPFGYTQYFSFTLNMATVHIFSIAALSFMWQIIIIRE
jgi:hypothetical protein